LAASRCFHRRRIHPKAASFAQLRGFLAVGKEELMFKIVSGTVLSLGLIAGAFAASPAVAAEVVGVHVGGVGLGFHVGNGHYYDRQHVRQNYTYPSDYQQYHHQQSWYRTHSHWNEQGHADYYRN
jgi:hypothetical protein